MIDPFVKHEEKQAPGIIVAPDGSQWVAWRKGDGRVTGYTEVLPHKDRYVSVPGSTRSISGPDLDLTKATR